MRARAGVCYTSAMVRKLLAAVALATVAQTAAGCCLCDTWFRNFERFECRSKQSEAKSNLRALHVAQEAYRAEQGTYGTLEEIGFEPSGDTVRYQYVLLEHSADGFVAEAQGKDEMEGDRWLVDQTGHVDVVESRCGPVPRRPPPPREDGEESGVIEVAY